MPKPESPNTDLLTLEEMAAYLKVSPKTIHRMLQAGDIPALKVGNQWRFLPESVLSWLEDRTTHASSDGLVKIIATAEQIIPITRLIGPERIVMDIPGGSKQEVLEPMVAALAASRPEVDAPSYLATLMEREQMVSTALGAGVAFPHVRYPQQAPVQRPCIVLGICPEGTDFESLDHEPTHVLALCCSPTEVVHLRVLAKASLLLRKPENIAALCRATSKRDVMSLLVKADCELSASF